MYYSEVFNRKRYNKPITYKDMATIETVNKGIPYYIAGPEFGYEGKHQPIAGSVFNDDIGTWVECTEARYKPKSKYSHKCSLSDDGVVYQTYSDRLAFLTEESARYYAQTGKTKSLIEVELTLKQIIKSLKNKYKSNAKLNISEISNFILSLKN